MKKNLLFAALVMGAMSVNAQEYVQVNAEAAGLTGDAAAIAGGTVLGSTDNVTMKLAYDDNAKTVGISFQGYNQVAVNGTAYDLVTGVTGSTNPSGQSLADGASTAASAGFVLQFDVNKDGYLTVFGKMSSNKEYYVWEGDAVSASPVAYTFAMDFSAAGTDTPDFTYTIPADEMGYTNFKADNIGTYVNGSKYYWPEQIVFGAESAIKKNGVGAITFPVYKDAKTYLVHAAGSKISSCGAVFTTEPVTEIALKSTSGEAADKVIYSNGSSSGISSATVATANENAPIYNLAGQRVSNSFKGIAIQNGKKFVK